MRNVEDTHQALDVERRAVLDGLRQVALAWEEESRRRVVFGSTLSVCVRDLLRRGKEVDLPVKTMAKAGGLTRRWAYLEIRKAR